ncbi:unnamed protein product [Periconia digitata]|uniref:Uncharacterized protein n=1 Tax=Periconia digitata TaxID=1303443 RepID=A0A9W4UG90_9PLEO|nr:unnamed protein product [Periconia digitata]
MHPRRHRFQSCTKSIRSRRASIILQAFLVAVDHLIHPQRPDYIYHITISFHTPAILELYLPHASAKLLK